MICTLVLLLLVSAYAYMYILFFFFLFFKLFNRRLGQSVKLICMYVKCVGAASVFIKLLVSGGSGIVVFFISGTTRPECRRKCHPSSTERFLESLD